MNISTDKAANPTTALGHSKRVAEKLAAWMAGQTGRKFVSVRFGNVMGSRGSMLPLFTEQIRVGGPVTVTDPEVTRFFMTIPEACQLVIQAGAIGRGGEVMILDMGEPVKILDVAQRMIAMSGKKVDIIYTGLRPGEKLHEELVGEPASWTSAPCIPKFPTPGPTSRTLPGWTLMSGWPAARPSRAWTSSPSPTTRPMNRARASGRRVVMPLYLTAGITLLASILLPFAVKPWLVRMGVVDVRRPGPPTAGPPSAAWAWPYPWPPPSDTRPPSCWGR